MRRPRHHAVVYCPGVHAVRATRLVKRFGTVTAVDGLDISIECGEIHELLGPNGAGKTTLLRMLFGLITPDSGTVELLGRGALDLGGERAQGGRWSSWRSPVSIRTCRGAQTCGCSPSSTADFAVRPRSTRHWGESISATAANHRADGCSTGMRQRLGIAAALLRSAAAAPARRADQRTNPAGTRAVAALVRELAAQGVAVLLSSHQIGELEKVCDSYTVVRHGRVVWDGTAAELDAQAPGSAYALF